jgi:hypothetical protein
MVSKPEAKPMPTKAQKSAQQVQVFLGGFWCFPWNVGSYDNIGILWCI